MTSMESIIHEIYLLQWAVAILLMIVVGLLVIILVQYRRLKQPEFDRVIAIKKFMQEIDATIERLQKLEKGSYPNSATHRSIW